MTGTSQDQRMKLYRRAQALAVITILYNIAEGAVSVAFGVSDDAFTLLGFGLDSFVEVISGIGIWHMTRRLAGEDAARTDQFERTALRVTGGAFYLLASGLAVTAGTSLLQGHRPETTFWGMVIGGISICTMWVLIRLKVNAGTALGSAAILADAACTRTCLYLSVILLVASLAYRLTGIGMVDAAGTLLIAFFAFREGRESFEKAAGKSCCCSGCG